MVTSILIGIIIVCLVIILDLGSKIFMIWLLGEKAGFELTLIPKVLDLRLQFNNGAAWSSFSGKLWFLMAVTGVATIIFIYLARYANFKKAKLYSMGIYMMIGGMLGNFFERAFAVDRSYLFGGVLYAPAHAVTDFIAFSFFPAVFNIADSFLTVGVILVIIDFLFLEPKRRKKQDGIFKSEGE